MKYAYFWIRLSRPLSTDPFETSKPVSFFSPSREPKARTPFTDEPLNDARRRAERVITADDSFFDVRGARVPKSSVGEAIREFDDEVRIIKGIGLSVKQHITPNSLLH